MTPAVPRWNHDGEGREEKARRRRPHLRRRGRASPRWRTTSAVRRACTATRAGETRRPAPTRTPTRATAVAPSGSSPDARPARPGPGRAPLNPPAPLATPVRPEVRWSHDGPRRSARGADADGHVAGVAHRARLPGRRLPRAGAAGGVARAAHPGRDVDAHRAPLGQGARRRLRRRRGLGDDPVVRDGPAVARPHGHLRRGHRAAVRHRGDRVLHRGDLPGHLPVRLGPPAAPGAPALRRADRHRRGGVGVLRGDGQRLDAAPRRASGCRTAGSSTPPRGGRCSTRPCRTRPCT